MHIHDGPLDVLTCKGFLPTIRRLCPHAGYCAFFLHLAHRPHIALPGKISLLLHCCPLSSLIPWRLGRRVLWSQSTSIYSIGAFHPLNGHRLVNGENPEIEVPPDGLVWGGLKDPFSGKDPTTVMNSIEEICLVALSHDLDVIVAQGYVQAQHQCRNVQNWLEDFFDTCRETV